MGEKIKAWHWLREDRALRYGPPHIVADGETLSSPDGRKPILCVRGLHASEHPADALKYAPGPVICRVEVWGDVVHGENKLVGRHRKVLWSFDARLLLHEHACWCAERALLEWSGQDVADIDERSLYAIEAKRAWLRGEIDDAALRATWNAAANAASAASAASAAWTAAGAAAWIAARGAAWSAASAAEDWACIAAENAIADDLLLRVEEEAERRGFKC